MVDKNLTINFLFAKILANILLLIFNVTYWIEISHY